MSYTPTFWIVFNLFIFFMLALDLGVFHRKAHIVPVREAAGWTALWILFALAFNVLIYRVSGSKLALEFLTGYLLEKSLSLDNIFVISALFSTLHIPLEHQHRVLFWGILGALVMRAGMIVLGIELIEKFNGIIYIFGGVLIFSAIQTLRSIDSPLVHGRLLLTRLTRWLPLVPDLQSGKFFIKQNSSWKATPLFVALLLVEFADLIFAIDSIPAILAVSREEFIVYTSNVFAILGLRSMYFLLVNVIPKIRYLKHAIGITLGFIGVKMILSHFAPIPVWVSLSFMLVTFAGAIFASLFPKRGC